MGIVTMKDRINMLIFPALGSSRCGPQAGCGCGSNNLSSFSQSPREINRRLSDLKYYLLEYYEKKISVDFVNYLSKDSILEALEMLNTALRNSGSEFEITLNNFFVFVTSTSPIIIIQDKIAFKGRIPASADIIRYITERTEFESVA